MSNQDIYEIARQRVDQRVRRWTIWAIHLAVVGLFLAGMVYLSDTEYANLATALFLGMGGIFAAHTIIASFAEARQGEIDGEVQKLRAMMQEPDYEKPKRLAISDEGELVDPAEITDTEKPLRMVK